MSTTQQSAGKPDQRRKFSWGKVRFIARAYGGSLVLTSFALPIVASGLTICFYLAPQVAFPLLPIRSQWYAPVYGFLTTWIVWLLIAALRSRFSTVSGANMHVYEELKNRYSELEARLSVVTIDDKKSAATSPQNDEDDDNTRYRIEASRRACKAYEDLHHSLFHDHSSIEWTLGTGYVNAWRMVHRTQEALVGVETLQEVIGDVVHDIRSIQNSAMPDSKALIRKMLQAVKDLCPEAMVYFDELRADKYYTDLFPPQPCLNFPDPAKKEPPGPKEIAREAIRQVKRALNVYQDSLRHKLVQGRNHTYIAIALAGFITYLLICIVILWNTTPLAIGTATAYYMMGAITGLFVRFYNETNSKNDTPPPDDYGLLLSRLIAIPILSGLSAIGGILITATLPALSGQSGQKVTEIGTIFNGTVTLEYLVAAAIFGFAPNLIVGKLQQITQRYSTDLQNTKGEVSGKDD